MTKIDMPLANADEAKKINELIYKDDLTTTGQVTFHSNSSNTDYDTNAEEYLGDTEIYNCGESGLLKLLIDKFSVEDGGWILKASDVNNKAEKEHTHGNISSDGKVGSDAGLALFTEEDGEITAGILSVMGGGTGINMIEKGTVLTGGQNNTVKPLSGTGVLYSTEQNEITFGTLPAEFGGTGNTSLSGLRASLGLGSSTGALAVENGGTGVSSLTALRNALGLGNTMGALPIANGGTGSTTVAGARNALGLGNTAGALPVANGGTGATSAAEARNNLGLGNTTGALSIANGGTGATTKKNAKTNLGIKVGTASPSGGEDGDIYIQYA